MSIADTVNAILRNRGFDSATTSLAARLIELLVLDPRTTAPGLAASLLQQTERMRLESPAAPAASDIAHEIVEALGLQSRLTAERTIAVRPSRQDGLARLRSRFPWPKKPPAVPCHETSHFTQLGMLELLEQAIDELQPRVIVEVGAWLGGSSRWLLQHSVATLISIDTWLGSAEHQAGTAWQTLESERAALLARLFETFIVNCWEFRQRLIALRTSSLDGFWQIASAGVRPDLILLDGAHDASSVATELELARQLFPSARLIVDDYNRSEAWLDGLVHAVDEFALSHGLTIVEAGEQACMLVE